MTRAQMIAERIGNAVDAPCLAIYGDDPRYGELMQSRPVVLYTPMEIGAVNCYLREGWMLHGCSVGAFGRFVLTVSGDGRHDLTSDDFDLVRIVNDITDGLIIQSHMDFPLRWCSDGTTPEREQEFARYLVAGMRRVYASPVAA